MANVIKFDCNYPKLCNQAKAKLVWFSTIPKYYFGKDNGLEHLLAYDTKRPDGASSKIIPDSYLLLFFVGDKGIMFSTLRKHDEENSVKYLFSVGQWFDVEVENGNVE